MRLRSLLYVRISTTELSLIDFRTGRAWREAPFVAFETASKRILRIGRDAADMGSDSVTAMNPFSNLDRGRITDPDLATIAIRLGARHVLRDPLLALRPDMVIHPLIEQSRRSAEFDRNLCGLGKLLSVRRCAVWYGSELDRAGAEDVVSRAVA